MLINHIEGEKYFATDVITSGMESRSQEIVIVTQRTKTNKFDKKKAIHDPGSQNVLAAINVSIKKKTWLTSREYRLRNRVELLTFLQLLKGPLRRSLAMVFIEERKKEEKITA